MNYLPPTLNQIQQAIMPVPPPDPQNAASLEQAVQDSETYYRDVKKMKTAHGFNVTLQEDVDVTKQNHAIKTIAVNRDLVLGPLVATATNQVVLDAIAALGAQMNAMGDVIMDYVGGRFDALDGRVDGLSDRVDGLSDRVDGLSDRVDELSDRVDELADQVVFMDMNAMARANNRSALIVPGNAISPLVPLRGPNAGVISPDFPETYEQITGMFVPQLDQLNTYYGNDGFGLGAVGWMAAPHAQKRTALKEWTFRL